MLGFSPLGALAIGQLPTEANIVSLVADTGSYTLSGQPLDFALNSSGESGSYIFTGNDASCIISTVVASGAYSLSGNGSGLGFRLELNHLAAADLGMVGFAPLGAFALGGGANQATLTYSIAGNKLDTVLLAPASSGAYALTGNEAEPLVGVIADSGVYNLSGQGSPLLFVTPLNAGAYSLAGGAASYAIRLPIADGSYSFSGEPAGVDVLRVPLDMESGVYQMSFGTIDFSRTTRQIRIKPGGGSGMRIRSRAA